MSGAVVLLSGGLDSATLLWHLLDANGGDVVAVSFDYGQRHAKELEVARNLAARAQVPHHIIALTVAGHGLASILPGSALTDATVAVPHGHYAADNMKATVVPNRNAIMLSLAYGIAVAHKLDLVALSVHAGDHAIYPDCRPEFVGALDHALAVGNQWTPDDPVPHLAAPFLMASKADIALRAMDLRVPIADTWSCYQGGEVHCGRCGTCVERAEAIAAASMRRTIRDGLDKVEPDPTVYADADYWKAVVATRN